MAVLLFKLNRVPDDEADEVRALLYEHAIPFYETSAGRWGVGVAAIWLRHNEQAARARQLLDAYQEERCRRVREEYAQLAREGRLETFRDRLWRDPIRIVIYLLIVAVLVAFTVLPFVLW